MPSQGFSQLKNRLKAAITGQIAEPAPPSAPPEPEAPRKPAPAAQTAPLGTSDQEAALSPRRLVLITDYMEGRLESPELQEPRILYKIVSDERAYQTRLLFEMQERMRYEGERMPKEEREKLAARIARNEAIVQNLFRVLKKITGRTGATGGTGFLSDRRG